ncbi:hypothetical protein WN51_08655 [Melipona quadrifasciata]|uniref:Uncharacterized protein n=1 Tax=Melipona quadrifasciata TaxID=166423 RepID=A0A0M9A8Y6_9HYME|nr:hypothetical protein WN51_08655 [Melipona quadrifasciata]
MVEQRKIGWILHTVALSCEFTFSAKIDVHEHEARFCSRRTVEKLQAVIGGLQMADATKWIARIARCITRPVTSKYWCARHDDNRHRVRSQILVKRMRFRCAG